VNRKVLSALVITLAAGAAHAFEVTSVDAGISIAWRFNAKLDSTPEGKQPSKVLFSPGVAMNASFDGSAHGVFFRPGAWLTWTPEEIYKGVARLSSSERGGHMKVLGLINELHFGYAFKIGKFDFGIQGGPIVHIRIPVLKGSNGTAERGEFWKAYYGKVQFIHLGINSWFLLPISEERDMVFGISCMLPFSNLWTGAPFAHGMQIGLTGAIRFSVKRG